MEDITSRWLIKRDLYNSSFVCNSKMWKHLHTFSTIIKISLNIITNDKIMIPAAVVNWQRSNPLIGQETWVFSLLEVPCLNLIRSIAEVKYQITAFLQTHVFMHTHSSVKGLRGQQSAPIMSRFVIRPANTLFEAKCSTAAAAGCLTKLLRLNNNFF